MGTSSRPCLLFRAQVPFHYPVWFVFTSNSRNLMLARVALACLDRDIIPKVFVCRAKPFALTLCEQQSAAKFLLIQEAWETLRDIDLRREYDSRLELQEEHVVVSEEVCEFSKKMK